MFIAKLREDGTILARAGTQTNCGGLAIILVYITENDLGEFRFLTSDYECEQEDSFGFEVAGAKVPPCYKDAVIEGAKEAFDSQENKKGIDFELINALVHQIDARENRFKTAGRLALNFWFENQTLK